MNIQVRPFVRSDRDQLTTLINAHVGAVIPNVSVSVNTLMSQLEREPGEFLVDPWVQERSTLVAVQRARVVAAAHLLRYGADEDVSESYRGAAEIRWLLCWPPAPYWPDSLAAGEALVSSCLAEVARWRPAAVFGSGDLPAPGVYGVPEQWSHIRDLYLGSGFLPRGDTEVVSVARIETLRRHLTRTTGLNLTAARSLGINGTRISAIQEDSVVGYIEIDTNLGAASRGTRTDDWADIGNLYVEPERRREGIGTWLLSHAAAWLDLGGVTRVLDYTESEDTGGLAFLDAVGFEILTRTERRFNR
ncbi:MAG: GNAT family N-acetyltransferase [Geodermatophilaceae bacterium]